MAQADQVAFLQIEQRAFIDQRMQQTILDDEQLVARQHLRQILDPLHSQRRSGRCQPLQQLGGDALQSVDQLVGVRRLLPE
ncbi:hypothetical protein FQZ97_792030 [compost metagenome]